MTNNNYCVIMAGGIGSRFWPMSRQKQPKQFLDILGTGKSLIRHTFERFENMFEIENIIVVTSQEYAQQVAEHIPEIPQNNILAEPLRRNTAPCIAYAYEKIKKLNPNANMVVAPSDHLILNQPDFEKVIQLSLDFVQNNDALLTLGIKPNRAETGYGYIQIENNEKHRHFKINEDILPVKTFTEKPNQEMAKIFFESGEFFWNSGIFIWSIKSIEKAFKNFLPKVHTIFAKGIETYNTESEQSFVTAAYEECPNISIDYGVMEHANNVFVLCSEFGWSDLGTWGSLFDNSQKQENDNVFDPENVFAYNTKSTIIKVPKDKLAVIQGLEEYIVVDKDEILLICKRENEQQIKQFVNDIQQRKGNKYI